MSTSGKRVDFPPVWSCIYVESTVSGQPAPLVHHNAGLISSSIKEHRLRLSLLTYSTHTSLLFEQWWTDVWSMDGLSYCITSAGRRIKKKKKKTERGRTWSAVSGTHCCAIKLTYGSMSCSLSLNLLFTVQETSGFLLSTSAAFF